MSEAQRLKDRVAIVTGAGRGIGLAIAQRFAAEGALVTVVDRDESGRENAENIDRATFVTADVSASADVRRVVDDALARHARIDILVNNAGILHAAEFLDLAEEDFDRVLRVNVKSAFLCSQAVAKSMIANSVRGAIVNMSSVNAVLAIPNQVPYTVSKGAVNQLTKVMALALAPHGIRVNAIGPGTIATDMTKGLATDAQARSRVMSRTPLQRIGQPSEIAAVAAFLASDDASYVTGQTIYPDGGRLGLNYTVPVE
ncbi:MAG TPA: SDR family oxidoreductase [Casimicrobiaceae bacterium]|nr:SDR family oxidoreductase [Casimicrobiaceae bacterium]